MLRRNLRHMVRYPSIPLMLVPFPGSGFVPTEAMPV